MINETSTGPMRVPPRLVLGSIVGLWATYFLLATLRGAVLGYDFSGELLARRALVTLAAMLVTGALWPVLVVTAQRRFWLRAALILVLSLPAAMLITAINERVFAGADYLMQVHGQQDSENGIGILRDDKGSVVEMGEGRLIVRSSSGKVVEMRDGKLIIRGGSDEDQPPAPPAPPVPPSPPPVPAAPSSGATPGNDAKPASTKAEPHKPNFWEDNVDLILGRYFLLLAWAAIYSALANAEQARAAERREGDYRRAAQAAELRSLRYQINPHFLFNTLNSLSALVLTGKREAAEQMIQSLSSFYRRSLTGDSTGDVSLEEEIALQRLYLEIEAVRFPERLRTVINVPFELSRTPVPGMILQPLVENSIKYAVAASRNPVTISIVARAENGMLVVAVADDGPGGIVQDGFGIGLANVRDRLRARFDGAAGLSAGPRGEGGFETVIRLPMAHG